MPRHKENRTPLNKIKPSLLNKELRGHIRSDEYLTFLKANADAVAYETYSYIKMT